MTGYLADNLYKQEKREEIIDIIAAMSQWQKLFKRPMSEGEKDMFRKLIQHLAVVCRVLSSDRFIKVQVFHDYCIKAYRHILDSFPWALLSQSIHR